MESLSKTLNELNELIWLDKYRLLKAPSIKRTLKESEEKIIRLINRLDNQIKRSIIKIKYHDQINKVYKNVRIINCFSFLKGNLNFCEKLGDRIKSIDDEFSKTMDEELKSIEIKFQNPQETAKVDFIMDYSFMETCLSFLNICCQWEPPYSNTAEVNRDAIKSYLNGRYDFIKVQLEQAYQKIEENFSLESIPDSKAQVDTMKSLLNEISTVEKRYKQIHE